MKSSFLLALLFVTTSLLAQTTQTTNSSFDKFYERLKMSYFGAYSGSSIGHWDDRALDEKGIKDESYVHNLFNQLSFNYNFGAKLNFVFNPRWTINTANTDGHDQYTNTLFVVEDFLSGFQGSLFTSEDKKFNYWTRIAARLPTSRSSRTNNITLQPDWMSILTYDFNPTWQLGSYVSVRQWVYQERFTAYRYRTYFGPYIQYTVNDTTRLALWYENFLENRKNLKSQNGKDPIFKNYWETAMFSVSKDVTPKLNLMPYVNYMLNNPKGANKPLENTGFGAWISYQIK